MMRTVDAGIASAAWNCAVFGRLLCNPSLNNTPVRPRADTNVKVLWSCDPCTITRRTECSRLDKPWLLTA